MFAYGRCVLHSVCDGPVASLLLRSTIQSISGFPNHGGVRRIHKHLGAARGRHVCLAGESGQQADRRQKNRNLQRSMERAFRASVSKCTAAGSGRNHSSRISTPLDCKSMLPVGRNVCALCRYRSPAALPHPLPPHPPHATTTNPAPPPPTAPPNHTPVPHPATCTHTPSPAHPGHPHQHEQ